MEFVNRVEIVGIVGNFRREVIQPADAEHDGKEVIRFSVVTEASCMDAEGHVVIDTTWFNCSAWGKQDQFDHVQKGMVAHVHGRLRMHRYINIAGVEREEYEVICSEATFAEKVGNVMPMEG